MRENKTPKWKLLLARTGFLIFFGFGGLANSQASEASQAPHAVDKSSVPSDSVLPKNPELLRQALEEANRKIISLEQSIKQSEITLSLVEEYQANIFTRKYDPNAKLQLLESTVGNKNYKDAHQIVQELQMESLQAYFGNSRSGQEIAPGSSGRRVFIKLQQQIADAFEKYQKKLQSALPANYPRQFGMENIAASRLVLSGADVQKIKAAFGEEARRELDADVRAVSAAAIGDLTTDLSKQRAELRTTINYRDRLNEAADKTKKEINELAIYLGLPLFCGTVVVLFVIPFLSKHLSNYDRDGNELPGSFQFSTLVEITTVLLLTMSILILGLASKLEPAVLGTLLGGISGYVLNKAANKDRSLRGAGVNE